MDFDVTVKRKPRKCYKCGSRRIAAILYGMPIPSPELTTHLESGRAVLGGCCVEIGNPSWKCVNCETYFYREKDVAKAKEFLGEL